MHYSNNPKLKYDRKVEILGKNCGDKSSSSHRKNNWTRTEHVLILNSLLKLKTKKIYIVKCISHFS